MRRCPPSTSTAARTVVVGLIVVAAGWGTPRAEAQPALSWPASVGGATAARAATTDEERITALRAVHGTLNDVLAQDLRALLDGASVEVRRAVLETVGRLTGHQQSAGAEIAQAGLRDPDATVRAAAVSLLDPVSHVSTLGRQLADPSPVVRAASARALGRAQSEDALAPLQRAMADPDRDVIVAAASALGALGHPAAVHALLERVSHPVESVRVAVVEALGVLALPAARAALVERMAADRAVVADAATVALLRLDGPLAVDALLARVLAAPTGGGSAEVLAALQGHLDGEQCALVETYVRQGRTDLLPLLSAAGPIAYPILVDAYAAVQADDEALRRAYLVAWLRSGDPRALDAWRGLQAAGALAVDDLRALLNGAPSADVFCLHTELPLPATVEDWTWLALDATRLQVARCLLPWIGDGVAVPHAARPAIAVALATGEPALGLPILSHWFPGRVPMSVVVSLLPTLDASTSGELVLQLLFDEARTVRRDVAARVSHGPALPASTLLDFAADDWDAERVVLLREHLDVDALRNVLLAALSRGDARTRAVAVQVGWASCGAVEHRHLVERFGDPSPGVRRQALAAAARCGILVESTPLPARRAEFAPAMASQADLQRVLEILVDPDADGEELAAAWSRLAVVGPPSDADGAAQARQPSLTGLWVEAAVAARQHADPLVRLAAAAANRRMGTDADDALQGLDTPAMFTSDWERAVWRLVTCLGSDPACAGDNPRGRVTMLVVGGPDGVARPDATVVIVDRFGLLHLMPAGPTGLVLLNQEGVRGAILAMDNPGALP